MSDPLKKSATIEEIMVDLLSNIIVHAAKQTTQEKKYLPSRGDLYPEMYFRQLQNDDGFVVGIEINANEKQMITTGKTLLEALTKLSARLQAK